MIIEVPQARLSNAVSGNEPDNRVVDNLLRCLSCLEKASDIVTKVASVVSLQLALSVTSYLPTTVAEICGNAIALIIEAAKGIEGAFSNLAVLAVRIHAFLETLKVHLNDKSHALPARCDVCDGVLQ